MKYACLLKEAIAMHHHRHSIARFFVERSDSNPSSSSLYRTLFSERNNNNNASLSIKLANHLIACKEYKGE